MGQGFTEGTRTTEWRRVTSPGVTMGSACMPTRHGSLIGHSPVHTQLLTASSCSPAADSAQQRCGWIWKVLGVSIYFLIQTLGIFTFIIYPPSWYQLVKTNSYIYRFCLQKGNKTSLLSAYEAKTAMEMAQPRLCWNRTVYQGREHQGAGRGRSGQG